MLFRYSFATLIAITLATLLSAQTVRWKIAPEYDNVTCISPSLLLVEKYGMSGLLGLDGTVVAPCQYDKITPVVEDRCLLLSSNGRLVAISDGAGNPVKQFSSKEIWYVDTDFPYYSEGLIAVSNQKGRWTYMDKAGVPMTRKTEFTGAAPFLNGNAVVRWYKDNSYLHINKNGAISRLDNQFKDNYLTFASSFTPEKGNTGETASGALVAVIVDGNSNVFLRDRSGKKVGSLGVVADWDKTTRKMTTDQYVIVFEANRQIQSITPKGKAAVKTYIPQILETYRPSSGDLATVQTDKGYNLLLKGKELLPAQFDRPLTIVSPNEVIASKNGYYGLLVIDGGYTPRLSLSQTDLSFEHHVPAKILANITIDPNLDESKYHVVIRRQGEVVFEGTPKRSSVAFDFLPDEMSESGTERFVISTDIDGIVHPEYTLEQAFTFKNHFVVKLPGRVRLNKANTTGSVSITITNDADSETDLCDILVDGSIVRKGVRFMGNESVSVSVTKSVNIQDLDNVSGSISVQVRETGCPAYRVSRKVVFERNL